MGEEQGLSPANLALLEREFPQWLKDFGAGYWTMKPASINRLLDAARSEGLQPVSVKGEEGLGSVGSGLTPLVPSPSAAGLIAQPSGVRFSAPHLRPGPWRYDGICKVWAPSLKGDETPVADIRGWGYLTGGGHGALNLPGDAAEQTQNAWGYLIAEAVNAHFAHLEGVAVKTASDGEASKPKARATEPKSGSPTDCQTSGGAK